MMRFTSILGLMLLLSSCGGGGGNAPRPPAGSDMELRQARMAAEEAEAAAGRARDAAAEALAGAEANRDADPASFALAESAAAAARTAWEAARATAAKARAATTLAEAQRHRDDAVAAVGRAQAALEEVRRHAGRVDDAHRRRASMDAEALRRARTAAEEALAGAEAKRDADPASFALAESAAAAARTAWEAARAAAAKARAATTLAEVQRHRDDAVAAVDRAKAALAEVRRYAGRINDADRRQTDMEALREARREAAEAATQAMNSMEFAKTVLARAEFEGNTYADPDGVERARDAVEEAEAAYRAAKAAAEKAQAATTVAEAEGHRADAYDAWQRAHRAALEANTYADRVLAARAVAASPELRLAPVFESGGRTNMGAQPPPPAGGFQGAATRNGVSLSTGTVRDGASADEVLAYLRYVTTSASGEVTGLGTLRDDQPVVRLVEGTDRKSADLARRAVRIVNAALPYGKRLAFDRRRAPAPSDSFDVSEGYIAIQFSPPEDWPYRFDAYPLAVAFVRAAFLSNHARQRDEVQYGQSSHVLVNTVAVATLSEATTVQVIVHELLHSLGFPVHTDPARFPGSTLNPIAPANPPPEILALVDRDALLAAYSRFAPGTLPEDMTAEKLGPWEETTFHLRGDLDAGGAEVSFGVGLRNGLARPWASGPTPGTDLGDNRALSGTATWTGALLGVSRPDDRTVAGNARLAVELATLDGRLDFTGLEHWGAREAPGAAGAGTTWGDGDLRYSVRVSGNAFVRTGGDAGDLTGAFFGSGHEGMGGVLERDDLAAGFGGKR